MDIILDRKPKFHKIKKYKTKVQLVVYIIKIKLAKVIYTKALLLRVIYFKMSLILWKVALIETVWLILTNNLLLAKIKIKFMNRWKI